MLNQTAVPTTKPATTTTEAKTYTPSKAVTDTIEILRKQGPLDYRDIVTARGHEIALLPPVNAGVMLRKKVANRFVYYLPGQTVEQTKPTAPAVPAQAKPAQVATITA